MKIKCPICEENSFNEIGDYDICRNCSWENDGLQFNDPYYSGGANCLSQTDYKTWWKKLNKVFQPMIAKYNVKKQQTIASWKFEGFIVPKENIKSFIEEATKNDIKLRLNFYNICKKYNCNIMTFHGFPLIKADSIKENNDKIFKIISTENPIKICKEYNLIQVVELLEKSKDAMTFWEENVPCIDVEPNPKSI